MPKREEKLKQTCAKQIDNEMRFVMFVLAERANCDVRRLTTLRMLFAISAVFVE